MGQPQPYLNPNYLQNWVTRLKQIAFALQASNAKTPSGPVVTKSIQKPRKWSGNLWNLIPLFLKRCLFIFHPLGRETENKNFPHSGSLPDTAISKEGFIRYYTEYVPSLQHTCSWNTVTGSQIPSGKLQELEQFKAKDWLKTLNHNICPQRFLN